ncbi:MAG: ATP-dependent DNA helicase RecG [Phycisphaerales bacterium]|nr:MAG: ATP-dependent DNA helicase RecG [Phycisphaerales bacterium]
MRTDELFQLIESGEDSGVEFKSDAVQNHELARELVSFLNLEGGVVLLGVEDDGTIAGTTRPKLEEWIAELCRRKIDPPIIPYLTWVKDAAPGKDVLAVRVPVGPDKPYARLHNDRRTYYIRVGSTCREAGRDELERMFQAAGRVQYGLKPVPGSGLGDLDRPRLRDYFTRVLAQECPDDHDDAGWLRLLCNVEFMTQSSGQLTATVDGMLLFGRHPKRFLPQSGVRAIAYQGERADYAARADEELAGPMTPLFDHNGRRVSGGLVEESLYFVGRHTISTAWIDPGGQRVDRPAYPHDVLREAIVNALVHRDYSIVGTDISLCLYSDRLEIESPGRLPNTATVEALKSGFRYARNQTLVNVLRDYKYVDYRGMGIRSKIIPGMKAHNGTEPDFVDKPHSFLVRLWLNG